VRDRLDTAVIKSDAAGIEELVSQLADEEGALADYYRAYGHYRLGEITVEEKKTAKQHLNECIDILKARVERNPEFAEAQALLATCYGVSAPFYMLRAATRGMAANSALEKALSEAPDNPRVVLAEAISLYFRPGAFGGDKELARKRLKDALALFSSFSPSGDDRPDWGEEEAWLYLARGYRESGDLDAAKQALTEALRVAPEYRAALDEWQSLGG
jgi:cytochrome c-type biogenesis protein CcmH/NrfG